MGSRKSKVKPVVIQQDPVALQKQYDLEQQRLTQQNQYLQQMQQQTVTQQEYYKSVYDAMLQQQQQEEERRRLQEEELKKQQEIEQERKVQAESDTESAAARNADIQKQRVTAYQKLQSLASRRLAANRNNILPRLSPNEKR